MIKTFTKFKRITTLLAGISMAAIPAVGQADWSFVGLGTAEGSSNAVAINDSGQVVGWSEGYAFITGPNGIGKTTLGESDSFLPTDINNSGQVVGFSYNDSDNSNIRHAFITGPNGVGMTDLGTFGGKYTDPHAINDSGVVIVSTYSDLSIAQVRAFITGPNGVGMTGLNLSGSIDARRFGINDSGQVVGSHNNQAFMTGPDGLGVTDLGPFKGPHLSDMFSYARDINDSGQVVGYAESPYYGNYHYGFITGPDGMGFTNLGVFTPIAINNSGEAVGDSTLFSHGGMTNLNLLDVVISAGWSNLYVVDINNYGQMVGYGIDNNGHYHAFLLSYTPDTVFTPGPIIAPSIPEPETYAMLLSGLGLLGFMARRRKAATA
jgi:probable HAF family extracellular repeat protein